MSVRAINHSAVPLGVGEQGLRMLTAIGLLPVLMVGSVALIGLLEPRFFGFFNVLNVLRTASFLAIVASGQMLVLIVGGFDLSVGAVVALSSVVGATAMAGLVALLPGAPAMAALLGLLAGLAAGGAVGLVNGLCVAWLRVSPFMVTLGTMSVAGGIALLLTNGIPVYGLPAGFVDDFGRALWFGIPAMVFVAVGVVALIWFFQKRTVAGRHLHAIGGNPQAALVSGVNTRRHLVGAYVGCSVLAALTGMLLTARIGSGQASLGGLDMTLQSIATAVIAGVSLRGGIGRVEMVAVGAVFLAVVTNAMNLLRVDSKLQLVVLGIILVLAVAFDEFGKRRQVRD